MKKQIPFIALLIYQFFLQSCKEDLYKLNPNGTEKNVPNLLFERGDGLNTIALLTPLYEPHSETIKSVNDIDIQQTNNYNQQVKNGIDVYYINTDAATDALGNSKLLEDILNSNVTLLIDGSHSSMEDFSKKYLPMYFPGAEMVAFRKTSVDSTNNAPTLETVMFGPKDNPLNAEVLGVALWFSEEKPDPNFKPGPQIDPSTPSDGPGSPSDLPYLTKEQFLRPNEIYDCGKADRSVSSTTVNLNDFVNVENYFLSFGRNWGYSQLYRGVSIGCKDDFRDWSNGCNYTNEVPDFKAAYKWWPAGLPSIYNGVTQELRRLKSPLESDDDGDDRNSIITWYNTHVIYAEPNAKKAIVGRSRQAKFTRSQCQACYMDFQYTLVASKSWSSTIKWGSSLKFSFTGGAIFAKKSVSVTVGYEGSKGKSQDVSESKSYGREFWVSSCMFKQAGNEIFGQAYAYTADKFQRGLVEYNALFPYIGYKKQINRNTTIPSHFGYISHCYCKTAPDDLKLSFDGRVKVSNYVIVACIWKDRNEDEIKTFKHCQ